MSTRNVMSTVTTVSEKPFRVFCRLNATNPGEKVLHLTLNFCMMSAAARSRSLASKEAIHNSMNNWRAGILTAGEARARSIPVAVCDERATKPAVKRLSERVQVIVNGLLYANARGSGAARDPPAPGSAARAVAAGPGAGAP